MWNRVEFKERAKANMRRNYWPCVAVAFIWTIVTALTTGGSTKTANSVTSSAQGSGSDGIVEGVTNIVEQHPGIIVGFFGALVIIGVIGFIIQLFVGYQLEVGKSKFFIENTYRDDAKVGLILSTYQNGSMVTVAWTRFLRDLFVFLWTLLLVIPGIIKSYEYRMIPYILADHPEITRKDAFAMSKEMTYGHKMDLFVLDLSFLGWEILAAFTCGIAGIFYVAPYYEQTMAEAYEALR